MSNDLLQQTAHHIAQVRQGSEAKRRSKCLLNKQHLLGFLTRITTIKDDHHV